jgi:hypothetical protein
MINYCYYYAATGPPLVLRQARNYFFDGRPRCGGEAGSGGGPRCGLRRSTEITSSLPPTITLKVLTPVLMTLYGPLYAGESEGAAGGDRTYTNWAV